MPIRLAARYASRSTPFGHRLLERTPEEVERRSREPLARLLGRAREADDGLQSSGDLRWVTTRLAGVVLHLDAPGADAVWSDLGRQPPLAELGRSPNRPLDIAAGIGRQRCLDWLGERFHVLEPAVVAAIGRSSLSEQDAQRRNALRDQVHPGRLPQVRDDGLELIAVAADRDPEGHAATAELVEGGHLLRQQDRVAHRQHEDPGGQPHYGGLGCDVCQRDQRLEIVRRCRPRLADILLGAQMIVAGDVVVAELLSLDCYPDDVLDGSEGHWIHHPGRACRYLDTEFNFMSTHTLLSFRLPSS